MIIDNIYLDEEDGFRTDQALSEYLDALQAYLKSIRDFMPNPDRMDLFLGTFWMVLSYLLQEKMRLSDKNEKERNDRDETIANLIKQLESLK